MKKLLVLLPFLFGFVFCGIREDVEYAMNTSVDPCQDFYQFSCGGWIAKTNLPADKSRYDRSFSIIEKHNQDILLSILQSSNTEQKLRTFYESCMDTDAIEQRGHRPLTELLQLAQSVRGINELMLLVGLLHKNGIGNVLFGLYVTIDAKNPQLNIAGFAQGGLGLPYPDLYLDPSNSSANIRTEYVSHIAKMLQLAGHKENATQTATDILTFETMLAQFTLPDDQLQDPFFTYNKLNVSGLKAISPNIPWNSYLYGLGRQFQQATVDVPTYFSNLSAIILNTKKYWPGYLSWQIINNYATRLSSPFVKENFAFYGAILKGQKEPSPRYKYCIGATDSALGELLGNYFVQEAFPGESKKQTLDILHGIEEAMKADITNLDWMDDVTRQRALVKLSEVTNMIGGPTNPKNYSDVRVRPKLFFENAVEGDKSAQRFLLKQIERPSDKSQWGMTPPTVNAYYDPTRNQMVFPAGILQQPFFNVSFPTAMNRGGIGMVMGHELTHGFDNQGRDYDGEGKLINWWEPATSDKFNAKVKCVIDQYSQFQPIPGVFVNGRLTQGENIADMGGIKNSFNSYLKQAGSDANQPSIIPGLTNAQLFFVAFSQGWCEKVTDQYLKVQVQTDPHSPAKFRVLGPLINLPQFSQTFQCAQGTPMNPTSRCEVW